MQPAAAYYRMSSDAQEASIPTQREQVKAFAKTSGYKIVAEYIDEGISGDDTAKRAGFQRMIADAGGLRCPWCAVLVWDLARLGRFDMLEAGYWLLPLRQAGVQVVTLDRGAIDWHDFAGRIVWGVEQEAKHSYLVTLSRDVVRGKVSAASEGKRMGGRPPLGYVIDRETTPGATTLRLGDPDAVALVRTIFAEYLGGRSLRAIAGRLNETKQRTGNGYEWTSEAVRRVLTNRVYVGEFRYGEKSSGRFFHATKDGPESTRGAGRSGAAKGASGSDGERRGEPKEAAIVIAGAHPAIIDAATFDRAAKQLHDRRRLSTPHADGGRFLLTGLLRCGRCDSPMAGQMTSGGRAVYYCLGGKLKGKSFCGLCSVDQGEVLTNVVDALSGKFLADDFQRRVKSRIREVLKQRARPADHEGLAKRLAELDRQLAKLTTRLTEVDVEFLPTVQTKLREVRDQRDELRRQVEEAARPRKSVADAMESEAKKLVDEIQGLARTASRVVNGEGGAKEFAALRAMLREILASVVATTRAEPMGGTSGRMRWVLEKTDVILRGNAGIS